MHLALYLALLLPHKPLRVPWPADFRNATASGCQMTEVAGAEPKDRWWHVYLWLEFPDHKWQKRIAIRPGNERAKALKDCDEALAEYEKARQAK